jgi:hypothetical protein
VLQGSLALLNGVSEPEPRREPRWPDEPQRIKARRSGWKLSGNQNEK